MFTKAVNARLLLTPLSDPGRSVSRNIEFHADAAECVDVYTWRSPRFFQAVFPSVEGEERDASRRHAL